MERTHTCGELTKKHAGKKVALCGWVDTIRSHGKITFIDLRDRYGKTQVVIKEKNELKPEYVVCIKGDSVDYGTSANTSVEGNQTATITAGTGLTGGITSDSLGDGFTATLNAQTTSALWNANQLQGTGITTIAPTSGQLLTYNGTNWTPGEAGNLLNAGDGIDITGNTINVDVTDVLGTGLSEDASNNITVVYGSSSGNAPAAAGRVPTHARDD